MVERQAPWHPLDAMQARDLDAIVELLAGRTITALTGAGLSTDSGIPDYRGPSTRHRTRAPIQHRDFLRSGEARARYWARAMVGWVRFRGAEPNEAHTSLARLEHEGTLRGIVTQNVDRLHTRAGSRRVIELHGALERVRCLDCGSITPRDRVQERLAIANPSYAAWAARDAATLAPDGDADVSDEAVRAFEEVACEGCGGTLKPDVVFFGDNVARPIVDEAFALVEGSEALLVAGTSLTVFSGFRFVRRAAERGIPVALVNLGETRGDPLATRRLDAPVGVALPALVDRLLRA
jgi:NAD-dependent deacetylase sirtuin 4